MGVVYKAEDTQLGRFAAIKVLPPDVSQDPQALERFLREARSVASLNHPNICSIYQIGDENGVRYIAMELLEGKNLRDRIVDSVIRLDQLLDWSAQFAAGLDAAHTKCILHRDIKPANLFVTEHGVAKILDFGLAKTVLKRQPAGMAGAYTTAVTTDAHLTTQGTTVGTVAVYVARTGCRRATGSTQRPVFLWRRSLRDGDAGHPFQGQYCCCDLWRNSSRAGGALRRS